jgi:lipid-binding SYLF domain-containing protein
MMTSERHRILVAVTLAASVLAGITSSLQARADDSRDKKVKDAGAQSAKAAKAFEEIMQEPDKAIPADVLAQARAIVVFPHVVKVAFAVGGEGGRGVVSRRVVNGGWGPPVFLRGGGGSVGPQVGASVTDFFLLLMTDASVEGLMKDKFELGAEVGVAAGPVGKYHGAGTDATMQAQILSYSRSHGLFAGVNVKGIVLKPEDDLNTAVYNKTARELLSDQIIGAADTDAKLKAFPQALGRYAVAASNQQ